MSKFKKGSSGAFGSWGAFRVKFKGDKVGCIPISDEGTEDTNNVTVISKNNAPDNLFEGKHVLQLSEDKKSIKAFKPYSGQHPAKFQKFSAKEGETPAPKTKTGEYGPYNVFYPVFEITDGPYKGCLASMELMYKFQEGDDHTTEFSGTKGARLEQLEEFLDTVIGDFDPPKWTDNLLPLFEKMANRAKHTVGLVFKKGWIVTLVELEDSGNNPPWKQKPNVE